MMIGRIEEKKRLQSLLYEEEPQFIAVFGRRRVGKTFLIRESFDYSFTFQHTGLSATSIKSYNRKKIQLDEFAKSLSEAGYSPKKQLTSWYEAFDCLKELIDQSKEKKKVIFIDELSWMDTKGSELISALEHFWNGWVTARREKDIILIVCASATYWMMDNIVNSKGGLHNRLTGQIILSPFTLLECEEYLKSRKIVFNRHQIIQCYMIIGGVPYYWSLLRKGLSLSQNIDELFFKRGAPLQDEYDNLYRALFNKPEQYISIIEALCTVNKGITRDEICEKTGIASSGELTKKLKELENCGFIRKYIPFGSASKNALYQLIDSFTLFYNRFLRRKSYDENYWKNASNSGEINAWSGIAFERVCLEHIVQIKKALGISGVQTDVNSWKCEADPEKGILGSQIDLLIVRRDQIINVCEMKYSESTYVPNLEFDKAMRRKISDLQRKTKTRHAIHSTLVTTYEVGESSYAGNIQSIITGDDLFG
ncbi:MAG: ATP-binding protein [Lachnospiraceae bacterium]|nr:ATP-binding protein [Lachnospiraceae bacterium]